MAKLVKILKGQSVTEQIDSINTNVENINEEIKGVVNNDKGYITANDIPVKSVQGKTGDVSLSAKDVEAFPNSSTIQELDINNLKQTGVYIGTYAGNPYYLVVIKYNETNIYQELIGLNFKKYRRFTTTWGEWIQEYSKENPVKASDITGINIVDTDKELTLAMLEDTTFVKADIKYNPSTKSLYIGNEKFATEEFVRNAVNMIQSIIVSELPETGVENTIYFVPAGAEGGNIFNEYVYVNGDWEIVGGTSVDLTPFLTKEDAEKTYAKISSLDDKVSKTTTINGKTLYNNITLNADDVGALSKDTILVEDVVYRHTNEEISGKLTAGAFVENDLVISIDSGTYLQGHMYKYNGGTLSDITDIITDYVDLNSDQNINGTKNFNGILRYGGVNVATDDDLNDYLPLTAGSTKPLTDDLYIASKKSLRLGNKAYLIGDDTDGRLTISPGKDRILTIRPNPDNSTGQMHIYGTVFRPGSKDGVQLGVDSAPWSSIYGTTIYQDGKQVANKEDIPDTSNLVTTDAEQTISGAKTFGATTTKVNARIEFTNTANPYIKMTTKSPTAETESSFHLQSSKGLFGIGTVWNKSTRWDADGNVMFTGDIAVVGEVEASSFHQNGSPLALEKDVSAVFKTTTYLYSGKPEAGTVITLPYNLSNFRAVLIEVTSQYYNHMFSVIPYSVFSTSTESGYAPFLVGVSNDYYTGYYVSDTSIKIKSKASVTLQIRIMGVN